MKDFAPLNPDIFIPHLESAVAKRDSWCAKLLLPFIPVSVGIYGETLALIQENDAAFSPEAADFYTELHKYTALNQEQEVQALLALLPEENLIPALCDSLIDQAQQQSRLHDHLVGVKHELSEGSTYNAAINASTSRAWITHLLIRVLLPIEPSLQHAVQAAFKLQAFLRNEGYEATISNALLLCSLQYAKSSDGELETHLGRISALLESNMPGKTDENLVAYALASDPKALMLFLSKVTCEGTYINQKKWVKKEVWPNISAQEALENALILMDHGYHGLATGLALLFLESSKALLSCAEAVLESGKYTPIFSNDYFVEQMLSTRNKQGLRFLLKLHQTTPLSSMQMLTEAEIGCAKQVENLDFCKLVLAFLPEEDWKALHIYVSEKEELFPEAPKNAEWAYITELAQIEQHTLHSSNVMIELQLLKQMVLSLPLAEDIFSNLSALSTVFAVSERKVPAMPQCKDYTEFAKTLVTESRPKPVIEQLAHAFEQLENTVSEVAVNNDNATTLGKHAREEKDRQESPEKVQKTGTARDQKGI